MQDRPLFARDARAAKLLDMPVKRFRELVAEGAIPPPVNIGGEERWDVDNLRETFRGNPVGEMRW